MLDIWSLNTEIIKTLVKCHQNPVKLNQDMFKYNLAHLGGLFLSLWLLSPMLLSPVSVSSIRPVQFCLIKYGNALLLDPLPLWWHQMRNKRCLMIFLRSTQYIHRVASTVSPQSHTHLTPVPCQSNASHASFSCQSCAILLPITLHHTSFSYQSHDSLCGLLLGALLSPLTYLIHQNDRFDVCFTVQTKFWQ